MGPQLAGPMELWAIRHGEVDADSIGKFIGSSDPPLSRRGKRQARAIAGVVPEFDAIIASPKIRAVETAEKTGKPEIRAVWREMDFGALEGHTLAENKAAHPTVLAGWRRGDGSVAPPGGESPDDFAARISAGFAELKQEFRGRTVGLFCHAGVNRALLANCLSMPYLAAGWFEQSYGSINILRPHDDVPVQCMNWVVGPPSATVW